MQPNCLTNTDLHAGSYMTFSAGVAHYSLNVGFIRYIASLDAIKTRETPDGAGHIQKVFEFEGEPIVIHRFCDLVGAHSLVNESADLISLLSQRRQDHIDWIEALEDSIRNDKPFTKATDPHKCAFGLWYDQYKPKDPELKDIMAKFDHPHRHIHSLAQKLLGMASEGGKVGEAVAILSSERFTTLKTLLNLFDQAENRLRDMVKPVVMIVDTSSKLYALELDNIEDIQEFEAADWLANSPGQQDQKMCYDGFFQKSGGRLYIKLDPTRLI